MKNAADPDRGNWKLVVFGILGVVMLAMASMAIGKYSVPPSAILRLAQKPTAAMTAERMVRNSSNSIATVP